MLEQLEHAKELKAYIEEAEHKIEGRLKEVGRLVEENQWKVLRAFRENEIGDHHFVPSTGYGYDDVGRDKLESVYASIFGTEAAIVRPQVISGTHAIACCLFGVLRPGDELMYITGKPYDTLDHVIGIHDDKDENNKADSDIQINKTSNKTSIKIGKKRTGSLIDYGIHYRHIDLDDKNEVDFDMVQKAISSKTKVIAIQRSRGYADRPSFTIKEIEHMIKQVKQVKSDVIIFIDNCYGEFVETLEPSHVGADLVAGSLIKNPGGGLAKSGGYIVGKLDLIEQVGARLFAPGIGLEGGANHNTLLDMYQGLFLAPHVVGEALKGAIFSSAILESLGFKTTPLWNDTRTDLIQSVQFDSEERLVTFCQGIQKSSPINAHVTPYPSEMPGYEDRVIMAAGTFVQGASIEFSADGPLRAPYLGFVQGGLTYEHVKIGILTALNEMMKKGLLNN